MCKIVTAQTNENTELPMVIVSCNLSPSLNSKEGRILAEKDFAHKPGEDIFPAGRYNGATNEQQRKRV